MSFFFRMIKSGMKSRRFYIALCVILLSMGISWTAFAEDPISLFENSYLRAFLHGCFGWNSPFPAVAPLIAAIPFAAQHVENCKSGTMKYMVARMGERKYLNTMFFANVCLTAITFIVGMSLFLLICFLFFDKSVDVSVCNGELPNIYSRIATQSPFLYAITLIAHCSFVSIAFSSIGFSLSFLFNNKFIAWISAFIVSTLMGLFAIFINAVALDPTSVFDVCSCSNTTLPLVVCYVLVVVGVAYLFARVRFNRTLRHDEEI